MALSACPSHCITIRFGVGLERLNEVVEGASSLLATTPVDMRKSFDGLAEVVCSLLGHDPLSGSLFVLRARAQLGV
ncbi:MAG: IS66 family insertion sequence element accessory protein TnpB [Pirellulales bacterium]|nr:IS66 family insertion sequence element accessory protein TnpB [Pirellulales bacterium]